MSDCRCAAMNDEGWAAERQSKLATAWQLKFKEPLRGCSLFLVFLQLRADGDEDAGLLKLKLLT